MNKKKRKRKVIKTRKRTIMMMIRSMMVMMKEKGEPVIWDFKKIQEMRLNNLNQTQLTRNRPRNHQLKWMTGTDPPLTTDLEITNQTLQLDPFSEVIIAEIGICEKQLDYQLDLIYRCLQVIKTSELKAPK